MMTALSLIFGSLTGPLFRMVTVPLLAAAALVGFHTLVENWKGNLRAQGERACDARWEKEIREEERKKAAGEVFAARELLSIERTTSEALNDQLDKLKDELEALRGASSGIDDGRCLSDGVLDRLGPKPMEGAKRGQPGADKGAGAAGPTAPTQKLHQEGPAKSNAKGKGR